MKWLLPLSNNIQWCCPSARRWNKWGRPAVSAVPESFPDSVASNPALLERAWFNYQGWGKAAQIPLLDGTFGSPLGKLAVLHKPPLLNSSSHSPLGSPEQGGCLLRVCDCGTQGHTCCFQMLVVNQASGKQEAAGDTIKVEGIANGGSDLPGERGWTSGKDLRGLSAGDPVPSSPQQVGEMLRLGLNVPYKLSWE